MTLSLFPKIKNFTLVESLKISFILKSCVCVYVCATWQRSETLTSIQSWSYWLLWFPPHPPTPWMLKQKLASASPVLILEFLLSQKPENLKLFAGWIYLSVHLNKIWVLRRFKSSVYQAFYQENGRGAVIALGFVEVSFVQWSGTSDFPEELWQFEGEWPS